MDELIRETVESKDPRLANAMDMLEKAFNVEFRLEYGVSNVVLTIKWASGDYVTLWDREDKYAEYYPYASVGVHAPKEDELVEYADKFTKDAYHTFKETETSLKMKLELRGETA